MYYGSQTWRNFNFSGIKLSKQMDLEKAKELFNLGNYSEVSEAVEAGRQFNTKNGFTERHGK